MALAIFDLDNTLIAGDSDYLWGQFLVDEGIVDAKQYEQANLKFFDDYKKGSLDIKEFLSFSLKPLGENDTSDLIRWREQFVEEKIKPILLPKAFDLIEKHRRKGDTLLVITATNRFVTELIVALYGIKHLLATDPEFIAGRYTGKFLGIPCFQQGKVTQLDQWLEKTGHSLSESSFYSDSHNDLPLLRKVTYPIAVNPDTQLQQFAEQTNWPVISLRTS